MELPPQIKSLYRHWDFHISESKLPPIDLNYEIPPTLEWFIKERMSIWKRKVLGEKPPYTQDKILAQYRFCNIFREFDRQTIEFHTLLNPLRENFPLWLLNMFYCRMVARPETIRATGLLSFDDKDNDILYEKLSTFPRPRYGTPYVFPISAILKSPTPTRELFIAQFLPTIIPTIANEIKTWRKNSVYDGVGAVLPIFGYNLSCLWTEVLIDVAYQFPEYLDLFARFPIGPGSLPTFKKLNSRKVPSLIAEELCQMNAESGITINGKPLRFSAENWEGIGCEFRKYTHLQQGKGRKRLYRSVTT